MRKLRLTTGVLAIVFITLTVISCKDNKKQEKVKENIQTEKDHEHSNGHQDTDKASDYQERNIEASTQKSAVTTPIIDAYILTLNPQMYFYYKRQLPVIKGNARFSILTITSAMFPSLKTVLTFTNKYLTLS